jgi:hypothetical protein
MIIQRCTVPDRFPPLTIIVPSSRLFEFWTTISIGEQSVRAVDMFRTSHWFPKRGMHLMIFPLSFVDAKLIIYLVLNPLIPVSEIPRKSNAQRIQWSIENHKHHDVWGCQLPHVAPSGSGTFMWTRNSLHRLAATLHSDRVCRVTRRLSRDGMPSWIKLVVWLSTGVTYRLVLGTYLTRPVHDLSRGIL